MTSDDRSEVERKMDMLDDNPLHAMMEDTAEKSNLLTRLHEDFESSKQAQLTFARRMLFACGGLSIIAILALVLSLSAIRGVREAQRDAASATASNTLLSLQNADLIDRLDEVAKQAQRNGAKTSRQQCIEIEKLKQAIRTVIRSSPQGRSRAADVAIDLFKARDCNKLPNSKPVKP